MRDRRRACYRRFVIVRMHPTGTPAGLGAARETKIVLSDNNVRRDVIHRRSLSFHSWVKGGRHDRPCRQIGTI